MVSSFLFPRVVFFPTLPSAPWMCFNIQQREISKPYSILINLLEERSGSLIPSRVGAEVKDGKAS